MQTQMPAKVLAATQAIKAANEAVLKVVSEYSGINTCGDNYQVSVFQLRDLDQIPGETKYANRDSEDYPLRDSKVFDDVEFYILLDPEEARAITEMAASA